MSTTSPTAEPDYDWVIVGSGFGGSVAALRLAEKGYRVAVIEQGRRFEDHDFAKNSWDNKAMMWAPAVGLRGIMKITRFKHVMVVSGVGVGGGSLVYANTLYEPHSDDFYRHPQWRDLADWRAELAPHYATATRMLGVTRYQGSGVVEQTMQQIAADLGVPDKFRTTPIGVFLGEPGKRVPDPYFGGDGPDRTGCVSCGQCMLGCRHGAKNTLVKNYLWFAEKNGATVIADTKVSDVQPRGAADGSDGFTVTVKTRGKRRTQITTRGVIFAAGALGTNELLRQCKDSGSLPAISDRLGDLVRTNSEAIPAATSFAKDADYRSDVAITSSIFLDERTHVTNNTYGAGGDSFALTFGPLTAGTNVWGRRLQFLARLPRFLVRRRVKGWSKRSIVFTVMQSTETSLRVRGRRFGKGLRTISDAEHPIESYLPVANKVAELAAQRIGGYAQSSVFESMLGAPTTAHFLGGAVIGASPADGVVDRHQRVFGYQNLLVVDGAAVPANVGVNPSLTITAMAEAAMSHIPTKPGPTRDYKELTQ